MFVGREHEMGLLNDFLKRKTAGLIVCRGRRRIGKSTLIQQFGKGKRFYEFWGLAPRQDITNADQLRHFGELVGAAFGLPALRFENWNEALTTLAGLTSKGRTIVLLDEISWMASKDKDFAGKLKGVWDTKFKKNEKLILILCGSVTSWIDDNILNDKGFMGRVSLTITLDELSLASSNLFWGKNERISSAERLKMLCVTGGVPRYLEEIRMDQTAEQNIKRMCFDPSGLLFFEFDKIFRDIFQRRSSSFKRIVEELANGPKQPQQLCRALELKSTGNFSEMLSQLVRSGFVARDYAWSPSSGRRTAKSKYRLKDNYLRFYLKYIGPEKDKIENGLYRKVHLENLAQWPTIMGLSLETLILNNLTSVIERLDIPASGIVSASPYFQTGTNRQKACQIDLLIHTTHTLYICEIRFRKQIEGSIIQEMQSKIERLKGVKSLSVRPVLIYHGKPAPSIKRSGFFSHLLPIAELLV